MIKETEYIHLQLKNGILCWGNSHIKTLFSLHTRWYIILDALASLTDLSNSKVFTEALET